MVMVHIPQHVVHSGGVTGVVAHDSSGSQRGVSSDKGITVSQTGDVTLFQIGNVHEGGEHVAETAVWVERGLRAVFYILYDVVQGVFQFQRFRQLIRTGQLEVVFGEASGQGIGNLVHECVEKRLLVVSSLVRWRDCKSVQPVRKQLFPRVVGQCLVGAHLPVPVKYLAAVVFRAERTRWWNGGFVALSVYCSLIEASRLFLIIAVCGVVGSPARIRSVLLVDKPGKFAGDLGIEVHRQLAALARLLVMTTAPFAASEP